MSEPIQQDDWVRFKLMPKDSAASPIRVLEALPNGLIVLAGRKGYFAAHLFVKVEAPTSQ